MPKGAALKARLTSALGLGGPPSSPAMGSGARLAAVLDGEAVPVDPMIESVDDPAGGPDAEAEHAARVRAEADATDARQRLAVAQEQIGEYAAQRHADAAELLAEADAAAAAADAAAAGGEPGALAAATAARALRDRVAQSAAEAAAFAALTKADAERAKRSLSAADLGNGGNGDVEMLKRPREGASPGPEDGDEGAAGPEEDAADAPARPSPTTTSAADGESVRDRARYIPLRLDAAERRLLALLQAALSVSQYTDKVDVLSWRSKTARVHAQIKDMCAILCGLVVAQDYKAGQALVAGRSFADNASFFQDVFEVGRRHKICNPEKMRTEYGKLVYMLMDSADPAIQELLEFKCVRPLRTVYSLLEEKGGLALLDDPLVRVATAEIDGRGRHRADVQRDIKAKERARAALARRYASSTLPEDDVLRCLYSIADNEAFLAFSRDPIDRMLARLDAQFAPSAGGGTTPGTSLAISGGLGGARLTHSHERQYHYVRQSLALWREISHDMFRLWCLVEDDLLADGASYRLTNTGQGLQRVQAAPRASRAMHGLVSRVQARLGSWVGSSVVHMGDHNVPNGLLFISKYCQVPQILNPVGLAIDALPAAARADPHLASYVDAVFGSNPAAATAILADFFRHAFDGSGADNFFDAGSCIDGRLTSAWNWCSKVEKKAYYNLLKVCGFTGFDGKWAD